MGWEQFTVGGGRKTSVTGSSNHSVRAKRSTAQTITDSTWTAIAFDEQDYDHGGLHSTTTNNTRLTAQVSGVYHITGTVPWDSSQTSDRLGRIVLNGSDIKDYSGATTTSHSGVTPATKVSASVYMTAGQYVEFEVYHLHGSDLDTGTFGYQSDCHFSMELSSAAVIGSGPPIFTGGQVAAFIGLGVAGNQTIATSTWTLVECDQIGGYPSGGGIADDPYGMVDTANNRIEVPYTGIYMISTSERWDTNQTGNRWVSIQRNTNDTYNYADTVMRFNNFAIAQGNGTDMRSTSYFGRLTAGDHVQMFVQQDSGANRTVIYSANNPLEQWGATGFGIALMQRLA